MILSIASLVLAFIAVAVNASGIIRRPRIVARSGTVRDHPSLEGISIIVTARRRPIQIDEIGVVKLDRRPRRIVRLRGHKYRLPFPRYQFPEWHREDFPDRIALGPAVLDPDLPLRLQDGESTRIYRAIEDVIDVLEPRTRFAYPYVKASGTVYLARERLDYPAV